MTMTKTRKIINVLWGVLMILAAIILMFRISMDGGLPQVEVIEENFGDWCSWAILGAAFIASFYFKANPILLIVAGGIAGLIIY